MIRRMLLTGTCLLATGLVCMAQDSVILPVVSVPPVPAEITLTNGTAISRPLQLVAVIEPVKATSKAAESPVAEEIVTNSRHALPRSWSRYDLLFWFPKAQPLPPLLTASPTNAVLGGSQSSILLGTHSIDTPTSAGGRFTWAGRTVVTTKSDGK